MSSGRHLEPHTLGGLTSKIHLAVDGRGLPMSVLLTPAKPGTTRSCWRCSTKSRSAGPGPKIDRLLRKWLARLPTRSARRTATPGYRYDIAVWQAEFSLTQVLDRPISGRVFFEHVIRDNLDAGRPDQVCLIFNRRVRRDTPGTFRTRVITEGVTPSLHIDYKHTTIKQYHKEGRALRRPPSTTPATSGSGNG
jgi:hypothetical protein